MKILYVITSLLAGGAERLCADLLLRIQSQGHNAEIAVFNAVETPIMEELQRGGVKVHRFYPDGGSVYSLGNLTRLRRLVREGAYDIVHTHNTAPQLFAALCSKGSRTKFVTTEHNTSNRRRGSVIFRIIDRWMYSRYDHIISISERTQDNLLNHLHQEKSERHSIIPNGIDISKYSNQPRALTDDEPVTITMVAGFRKQKDHDTLVKALTCLPPRYRVNFAGDGERREEIERLAKELGVDKRINFMGAQGDIPKVLRDSDIIVLSSHYEGLSLASIEGMASGRPFVASDVDGLSETVEKYGLLFPEGDDKALADILLRLGTEPEFYKDTVISCQSRAKDFDINNTLNKYLEVYSLPTAKRWLIW